MAQRATKPKFNFNPLDGTGVPAFVPVILLFVLTLVAYVPAFNGGFIWDDDDYVTRNSTLNDVHGLYRIWFEVGAVPQYYPLVHTTFWLEKHLWGLDPFYFHLANVLLHGLAAVLLWRALKWLKVPGAWFGAAIFALHPVMVESVAWITERKNVLSAVFYFAAALAYFRFLSPADTRHPTPVTRRWIWYGIGLGLFICALLSKTVTCSLPAALLLLIWWKKGLTTKEQSAKGMTDLTAENLRALNYQPSTINLLDVLPLVPFFVVGAALGLLTAHLEKHHVGAQGTLFAWSFWYRCLIAGRAVWFYAAKLVWPWPLTFIYPRWHINTGLWWQWLFPAAALGLMALLWAARGRIGKGPLVAVLFFVGTLFPALGFVNVYPMRFSYVADHFQYLASVGLIALFAAGVARLLGRAGTPLPADSGTGRAGSPLPAGSGTQPGAQRSARPTWVAPLVFLMVLGLLTWNQCRMYKDHETLWRVTLERNPNSFIAHNNLGNLLLRRGLLEKAMDQFNRVVQLEPTYEVAYYNLGNVFSQRGQHDQAIVQYQKAIQLAPRYIGARNNLANEYLEKGRLRDALAEYETAMRLDPNSPILCANVAKLLATSPDATLRNGPRAVELAQKAVRLSGGRDAMFVATLGAAYAEAGQFPAAIAAARNALDLAWRQNNTGLAQVIGTQISLYQAGKPFRVGGR